MSRDRIKAWYISVIISGIILVLRCSKSTHRKILIQANNRLSQFTCNPELLKRYFRMNIFLAQNCPGTGPFFHGSCLKVQSSFCSETTSDSQYRSWNIFYWLWNCLYLCWSLVLLLPVLALVRIWLLKKKMIS